MRDVLRPLSSPDGIGLAYGAWAPVGPDGKVPDDEKADWLETLVSLTVADDYEDAYRQWRSSFVGDEHRAVEIHSASRLLIGHGNASPTEVGLTVHHTWGVPVIPGTALKGLLAHYLHSVYGPENPHILPWEQDELERERARYQGVTWGRQRIRRGPGDIYRAVFGAPEAEEDSTYFAKDLPAGAIRGRVTFHDALYVPGSAADDRPFAMDVITVHQKFYYRDPSRVWPNDYDDPNPFGFLTVRPGASFLLVLSGPSELTEPAERLLLNALLEWGVGAKTSSGYGRLIGPEPPTEEIDAGSRPMHKRGELITVIRVENARNGGMRFRADDGVLGHFVQDPPGSVAVGQTMDAWVGNVSSQIYTLRETPSGSDKREKRDKKAKRRTR